MVVSNHAYIYPDKRGRGLGTENHRLRVERAKELGYDAIVCTVRVGNVPEEKILENFGWKKAFEFTNKVTGNRVGLWALALEKTGNCLEPGPLTAQECLKQSDSPLAMLSTERTYLGYLGI